MDTSAPARERLAFLDFARGVAALLVVFAHAICLLLPPGQYIHWSAHNLELGRVGVVLFLLISGFIIPASLEQGTSLGKFWLRRFFRLFPAYWLCMAMAGLWICGFGPRYMPVPLEQRDTWLMNLTMCQGFFRVPDVVGVFWTLQLELVAYGCVSLLFALGWLHRIGWRTGMLVVLAYIPIGLNRPLLLGFPYTLTDTHFMYVLPLVGLLAQRYHAGLLDARRFYTFVICQVGSLVVVWAGNKALFPDRIEIVGLWTWLCNWGVAYAIFLVLLELRRCPLPAFGVWLGKISYSMYLIHPLVLVALLSANCPRWAFLVLCLTATIGLAALMYHAVEAPGIRLGRWVERWLIRRKRDVPMGLTPRPSHVG